MSLMRLIRILVLGSAVVFSSSISAATVLQYSPTGGGTQILGLMVDGISYDVRFEV